MTKIDPYKHKERYLKWKKESKAGILEISKYDSDWEYNEDLEKNSKLLPEGRNIKKALNIGRKIGRNEKCPCGSGIKYKKCCLEI